MDSEAEKPLVTLRDIYDELKEIRKENNLIKIELGKHKVYIGVASAFFSLISAMLIKIA